MDLSHKIIIGLLVILILLTVYKKQENAGSTSFGTVNLNTEAISNIASVYSESLNGTASFNNLRVTNNINFSQFKGIIVAWSGAVADIPAGWGFCDGTTYTALDGTNLKSPDLRSSFIIGASKPGTSTNNSAGGPTGQPSIPYKLWLTPRQVNDQDGEEKHTLSVNEIPSHTHNYSPTRSWHEGGHGTIVTGGSDAGTVTLATDGGTGGNGAHNNMPPFYALAYIIKL